MVFLRSEETPDTREMNDFGGFEASSMIPGVWERTSVHANFSCEKDPPSSTESSLAGASQIVCVVWCSGIARDPSIYPVLLKFARSLAPAAKLDSNYELEIPKLTRVVKNISISLHGSFWNCGAAQQQAVPWMRVCSIPRFHVMNLCFQ